MTLLKIPRILIILMMMLKIKTNSKKTLMTRLCVVVCLSLFLDVSKVYDSWLNEITLMLIRGGSVAYKTLANIVLYLTKLIESSRKRKEESELWNRGLGTPQGCLVAPFNAAVQVTII